MTFLVLGIFKFWPGLVWSGPALWTTKLPNIYPNIEPLQICVGLLGICKSGDWQYTPSRAGPIQNILFWASSTGHVFSRIALLRTPAWQLLRFTRKYMLSRRIYYSIVFQHYIIRRWLIIYCIELYSNLLNFTVLQWVFFYRFVLFCLDLYRSVLFCLDLYRSVLLCTFIYCFVLFCAFLYYSVLFFTVLTYSVLIGTVFCTVLYCTFLHCSVLASFSPSQQQQLTTDNCNIMEIWAIYHSALQCQSAVKCGLVWVIKHHSRMKKETKMYFFSKCFFRQYSNSANALRTNHQTSPTPKE